MTGLDLRKWYVTWFFLLVDCKLGYVEGTSFAAPIVTGAVALLWGQDPSLTYKEVISIVFESVRKVAELDGK